MPCVGDKRVMHTDHGGDAGADVPDVGQTSREDLPDTSQATTADDHDGVRDDDIAAGHIGEPGGPSWARSGEES
ncbi:hypothetical protein GCM10009547_39270 [Sporichthya brevicatena]|uniref:Uncharacterized protein n=2 Tax=Sporichthya brevicatena TaxID=171442 RepID=A0ABN1H7E5_9ACTN